MFQEEVEKGRQEADQELRRRVREGRAIAETNFTRRLAEGRDEAERQYQNRIQEDIQIQSQREVDLKIKNLQLLFLCLNFRL